MNAIAEEHAGTEFPWQAQGAAGILRGWQLNSPRAGAASDVIGVYVHGFRSDCDGAKSLALARHAQQQGYAWLRFDLGGHGASAGRFGDFRLSHLLADLNAALAALPQRRIVLVGSSMGAWLAVLAARQWPQRIAALVLLAPGFNFLQRLFAAMTLAAQRQWQSAGIHRFASHYDANTYELEFAAVADADAHDVLSEPVDLPCPVHIIHGEQDEVVPIAISENFFAKLRAPHRKFTRVPAGDHRLTDAEATILAAVDRLWPRS